MSGVSRDGLLPPADKDHYVCLPGAQVVATRALMQTRDNLKAVIEAKAMMCLFGNTGHGKSFAVNTSLRELAPDRTHRIQFRARPTTRDLRHELFYALRLPGPPPQRPIEFDRVLRGALAQEFRVVLCDEAQWLSKHCFEYLRYLWDDMETDLAIVFTGGNGCFEVLQNEPMLESRIYIWQEIPPMPLAEVQSVIPAFHPVWAAAPPELIVMADNKAAHGNFRTWAKITDHILQALRTTKSPAVNEQLLRWVYSKLKQRRAR